MNHIFRYRADICWILVASLFAIAPLSAGVAYQDPGWTFLFEGDEAYYHDPDGPNPDYLNGSASNVPGGQSGTPALDHKWLISGSQWDGSAPGDPLGGTPGGSPPIPPAAPGGVGTYNENGVSYLRIQDAGQPQSWGWADKGAQASPTSPRQEGNNRRIQFAHPLAIDSGFDGNVAVLDNGITISFRARLSTTATGPLDSFYSEDGPSVTTPQDWPNDGKGYPVSNNGRGMFMVTQNGVAGPGQLAFSLLDEDTIVDSEISVNKPGLVFNNKSGGPNTDDATESTINVLEIADGSLTEWQEFWITVKALPAPVGQSTHEVNVFNNGALTPQSFLTVLGNQNEFGAGAYLGLGLSSGTAWGAFDVDFFAYKQGFLTPTLAGSDLAGDYDHDGDVDDVDLVVWQEQFNETSLAADGDGDGDVDGRDFLIWQRNYGASAPVSSALIVPETTTLLLGLIGTAASCFACRN